MTRPSTAAVRLVSAALALASWPAAAASIALLMPERPFSLQGIIPLPELYQSFSQTAAMGMTPIAPSPVALSVSPTPAALPLVDALPPDAPLPAETASAIPPLPAPPAASPSADAARETRTALSRLASGGADAPETPEKIAQTFDGSGLHRAVDGAPRPQTPAPRLPASALPLPIVIQGADYSCGAAALLAALYYWQVFQGYETDLYAMLETTPKQGTEPAKIAEAARLFGLQADMRTGVSLADLRAALGRGETVIVDFQAWHESSSTKRHSPWPDRWDDGHYAVVAGMDEHYVYLMDPSAGSGYAYVPLDEFMDRWHDYEDRHGSRQENRQLAVFLKGATPLKTFPGPLVPVQ